MIPLNLKYSGQTKNNLTDINGRRSASSPIFCGSISTHLMTALMTLQKNRVLISITEMLPRFRARSRTER